MTEELPNRKTRLQALSTQLWMCQKFVRFAAFGFSAILPLLGAGTVTQVLSGQDVLGLLAVAFAFHNFSFVFNDVIDYEVDKTQPLRADYPMVVGWVKPNQGLVFALMQIPLGFAVAYWLESPPLAYVYLSLAFVLMAVYDLWGKRTACPPLTDLAQGLGFGCMALYGAALFSNTPTALTVVLFAFVVIYIVLINGIHGSLRDLRNDFERGMLSTAILLGGRPDERGGLVIPPRLTWYAWTLQLTLVGLLLLPVIGRVLEYSLVPWAITFAGIVLLSAKCIHLLWRALLPMITDEDRGSVVKNYLVLSMASLIWLFAFHIAPMLLLIVVASCVVPLLPTGWWADVVDRGRSALRRQA